MTTVSPEQLREDLRVLGERRARRDKEDKELTADINDTLALIERAGISKSEAARRLGVHRTTLYRVYKV